MSNIFYFLDIVFLWFYYSIVGEIFMIYMDNAATTLPKPQQVVDAVVYAMQNYANPSRGSYDQALDGLRCLMMARMAVADLFCCDNPMDVAFSQNATHALNIAIGGIRGHIVTTASSHNSVLRPLYKRGDFSVVPLDKKGVLNLEWLKRSITDETEAVVISHASNLTGNVVDINAVGQICKEKGVRLIIDAAQTAGLIPLSIKDTCASAICFSGHKSLYGPQGTGGIVLGNGYVPRQILVGGSGSESFSPTHPTVMPDALEAGTQNAHGIAGLLAGINYIKDLDGKAFAVADKLARMFINGIKDVQGVTLYGDLDAPLRTPVVSLNIDGINSSDVAAILAEKYDIGVRAGAHCAPLMHKTLGTQKSGAVRFSFSHFNDEQQVDLAIQAIKQIANTGGK